MMHAHNSSNQRAEARSEDQGWIGIQETWPPKNKKVRTKREESGICFIFLLNRNWLVGSVFCLVGFLVLVFACLVSWFVLRQFLHVVLAVLEHFVDQAGFKFKRSAYLCLWSDGIKDLCHHLLLPLSSLKQTHQKTEEPSSGGAHL